VCALEAVHSLVPDSQQFVFHFAAALLEGRLFTTFYDQRGEGVFPRASEHHFPTKSASLPRMFFRASLPGMLFPASLLEMV